MTKIVWVTVEDGTEEEHDEIVDQLGEHLPEKYRVVVSTPDIELMSREELLDALQAGDDDE